VFADRCVATFAAAPTPGPLPVTGPASATNTGTPIWLSILLSVVTLAGVLITAYLIRRTGRETRTSAEELDRRGKREETMRTLRWSAERAISKDDGESRMGIAALSSIGRSPWLETEDQDLIDSVIASLTASAVQAYHELDEPEVYATAVGFPSREEDEAAGIVWAEVVDETEG
jgi:hypothetical protein